MYPRNHTLALIHSTGRIYGCGLGGSGQLGTGQLANQKSPSPVRGNWCPLSTGKQGVPVDKSFLVKRLFAGGDQSFATFTMPYVSTVCLYVHKVYSCLSVCLSMCPLSSCSCVYVTVPLN